MSTTEEPVVLELTDARLDGDLTLPPNPRGLVVFVHGSGSSRRSSRNRFVASALAGRRFATLLFDLLTEAEDRRYETRFDIGLLTRRLLDATAWTRRHHRVAALPLAYFGASTGAAAALNAAAQLKTDVAAVVARGGRPDLALENLPAVTAPTVLIVGGADEPVIELNKQAYAQLRAPKELAIVAGATHLFEEPGTLEEVATLAGEWLQRHVSALGA
ncbi:MAG: dienelactone hydrolase family protein [Pseudomonadota bacterium]